MPKLSYVSAYRLLMACLSFAYRTLIVPLESQGSAYRVLIVRLSFAYS